MSIIFAMKTKEAKPFVKWAGGKQALVADIVAAMPERFSVYFEPFVGGGSVFLRLSPGRAKLSDANEWLIQTYQAIRDDWRRVAGLLDSLPNTKADYLAIRRIGSSSIDRFQRAAHFVYLNKTCFRGLYRVNRKNEFNVPYGAYDRRYYDPENLEAVASALEDVKFTSGDFECAIASVTADDFVYFDPPYYKQGGFADFNRYTPSQFREGDHFRLAAVCRELDARGVRWLLSNSDTPFVRELFDGFEMNAISARRDINLKSTKRSINELLICNY
ncbi:MAG: Dam family site-specific DNA-(adenine-N6)-methyltransferase [Planctomycetaceae bacterium]|nr:MAG: Dam family site-specific DNA-(adenine-N6)-methyltransferase [Planctomycetaceae bacterium]